MSQLTPAIAAIQVGGFEALPMAGAGLGFWAGAFVLLTVVIHIAFAFGVLADAQRLATPPEIVGPFTWAGATLLGGLVTAVVYWALHHSTLSRRAARALDPHDTAP